MCGTIARYRIKLLNRAVVPHFQFVQIAQEWSDVSIATLRSLAHVPSI